jgi:hypothetical protein
MAVQQAVMIEANMGHLPDENKWNVDASTMIIEDLGKNGIMCRVVSCAEGDAWEAKLLKNPLTSVRFQSGLDMGLKWMLLDNGIGDFGKMVLIVAVPGMAEGDFFAAEVGGLAFGADNTMTGWIYFSNTRCMKGRPPVIIAPAIDTTTVAVIEAPSRRTVGRPKASASSAISPPPVAVVAAALETPSNAWKHYFLNVFKNDINYYASNYNNIDPKTGERFANVCTIDGESVITREILDDSVWAALAEDNIKIIKNRPSGTEFDNANDASDNFRDKNTGLRECVKNNVNTTNKRLETNLDAAFAAMKAAHPAVTMSAAHWTKAKMGVSRFVHVCKTRYVSSGKGVVGFQRTRFKFDVLDYHTITSIPS